MGHLNQLRMHFDFAKLLEILPFESKRIHFLHISFLTLPITMVTLYYDYEKMRSGLPTFYIIIVVTERIFVILLYLNYIVTNFTHPQELKKLWKNLNEFDEACSNVGAKRNTASKKVWFIVMNISLLLAPMGRDILYVLTNYSKEKLFAQLKLFPAYWILFYASIICSLVWNITSDFKSRYCYLKRCLCFMKSVRRLPEYPDAKQNFMRQYKLLYNAIDSFNKLFGNTLTLLLAYSFSQLLWGISLFMLYTPMYISLDRMAYYILNVLILIVVLIRACDKLEKSGEDIVKTCYFLQEDTGNFYVSNELLLLIEYLKALAPKITASGLFYINRKLFSSIFSVASSYVIIILQFRNG